VITIGLMVMPVVPQPSPGRGLCALLSLIFPLKISPRVPIILADASQNSNSTRSTRAIGEICPCPKMVCALMTTRRTTILTIVRAVGDGIQRKPATAVRRVRVPVALGVAARKRQIIAILIRIVLVAPGGIDRKRQIVAMLIRIVPVALGVVARRNKPELAGRC
jgi:hypothetical protein